MAGHHGGVYRGIVKDVADPEKRRRIRVVVPSLMDSALLPWALPCQPPGVTGLPAVGKTVWVMFEGGHIKTPVWLGVWEGQQGVFSGTALGSFFGSSVGSHTSAPVSYVVGVDIDATNARVSATVGPQTGYSLTTHGH